MRSNSKTLFALSTLVLVSSSLIAEEPLPKAPIRKERERKLNEKQQAIWDKAREILSKPDHLILYSLDPVRVKSEKPKEVFRDWKVLGKTEIKDAEERKKVISVAESSLGGQGSKCFEPRHGIRAGRDGKSVDLVICFACSWVYVYLGKSEDIDLRLMIPRESDTLDKVLKDAKIPLPTPSNNLKDH